MITPVPRASLVWLAAAVMAGVAGRYLAAWGAPMLPPVADMGEYWQRGVHLYEQGTLPPDTWRVPGLPIGLAAAFGSAGRATLAEARALNLVAAAVAIALTGVLALRGAGRRGALAAGVVAVYPSYLLYAALVATESVVTAPILAALLAAMRTSVPALLTAGIASGVATLVRPMAVAVVPAALAGVWLAEADDPSPRARLQRSAVVLVAFAITLAPWWAFTARHGGLVPFDTTSGLNFAIGNGPLASGKWHFANVSALQARYLPGIDVTTRPGAAAATAVGVDHLRADPASFVRLAPAKLAAFFALEGREHAYLFSHGYFGEPSPLTVRAWGLSVLVAFPVLLVAAALGAVARDGLAPVVRWPAIVLVAASAGLALLAFGDPRFHLPLIPALAVLAAGAPRARQGLHRGGAVVVALAIAALLPAWASQYATYRDALDRLATPGGAHAALSFDDLLK